MNAQGVCVRCGGPGQLACLDIPGRGCDPGYAPNGAGVCAPCGKAGQRACPGKQACADGLMPNSDNPNNIARLCVPCGKAGQRPCGKSCAVDEFAVQLETNANNICGRPCGIFDTVVAAPDLSTCACNPGERDPADASGRATTKEWPQWVPRANKNVCTKTCGHLWQQACRVRTVDPLIGPIFRYYCIDYTIISANGDCSCIPNTSAAIPAPVYQSDATGICR